MDVAKLFTTGGSQAVRLPKDYRFEGTEVFIRKEGKLVVLQAKERGRWPEGFSRNAFSAAASFFCRSGIWPY